MDGSIAASVKGLISNLISSAEQQKLGSNGEFDAKEASKILTSKTGQVLIGRNGDKYQVWLKDMNDPKYGNIQKIDVNPDQIRELFPNGDKYLNRNLHDIILRNLYGGYTSSRDDNGDHAFMKQSYGDFSGIKHYQVAGDLKPDSYDPSLYVPVIHLKRKDGQWATFSVAGLNGDKRVGFEQGKASLNSLIDDPRNNTLKQLLDKQYPGQIDWSQIETK